LGTRVSGQQALIASTLNNVELFTAWPESAKSALRSAAELWRFEKGEAVVRAGEPVTALVVLAEGSVTNDRTWPNGKYMITAVLRTGWPLKVPALWDGLDSQYGLTARENCLAVLIPRDAFFSLTTGNISILHRVTDFICRQLRHEIIAVQMKTVFSLRCQLALTLFYHAQTSFHTTTADDLGNQIVPIDVTQDEFASILGCSRQKINNLMREMERDGIIKRKGRQVEIASTSLLLDAMEEDEPIPPEMHRLIAQQRKLFGSNLGPKRA
jgi:CRP-like cAMP-binding protein